MDPVSWLVSIPGIGPYLPYVMAVVTLCAALAMALPAPTSTSSKFYDVLYAIVNWVALNMGHAKNASAPKKE